MIGQLHTGLSVTGVNWRILFYCKINSSELLTYSGAWSGYKRYRKRSYHGLFFFLVWCAVSFYDTMQFLINRTNFSCSKKIPYHMANYLLERKSSREMRRSYYQTLCESYKKEENPIKVTSRESRFVTSYKTICGVLFFFQNKINGALQCIFRVNAFNINRVSFRKTLQDRSF